MKLLPQITPRKRKASKALFLLGLRLGSIRRCLPANQMVRQRWIFRRHCRTHINIPTPARAGEDCDVGCGQLIGLPHKVELQQRPVLANPYLPRGNWVSAATRPGVSPVSRLKCRVS